MITAIVLLSMREFDRTELEHVEGSTFDKPKDVIEHFREGHKKGFIAIFPLTDFVDACNDEKIILDEWWVGTVQINIECAAKMEAPYMG